MVNIRFYRKEQRGSVHMVMEGHADTAPKGKDLVCAGASMLAYTAGQAVRFLYEQGKLACRPRIQVQPGKAVIIATPKKETVGEVLYLYWVVQAGAYVLARNFPRAVGLEPLEIRDNG